MTNDPPCPARAAADLAEVAAILAEAKALCSGRPPADPDAPNMLRLRASFAQRKHLHAAVRAYLTRAGALDSTKAAGQGELAHVLDVCERTDDEMRGFCASPQQIIDRLHDALAIDPYDIGVCRQLVCLYAARGCEDELAQAWLSLGVALENANRLRESAIAYQQAISHKPDLLAARFGLGALQIRLGEPRKAIPLLLDVLAREPEHIGAHQSLGVASALVGNVRRTFEEIAWFDQSGSWRRRHFDEPMWDGSSLEGRTILLWSNAMLGDTIQMLRFVQAVKDRGARVIVECSRKLMPLVERMPCVDVTIPYRMPPPLYDAHALLASVGQTLQITLDTLPAVKMPYLTVDPELTQQWRRRLGDGRDRKIGLVWGCEPTRGNASTRSAFLAAFKRLAGVRGVRIISLQQGLQAIELLAPPQGLEIEGYAVETRSIAGTAALMSALDLVIAVDTMTAHLAGALARPVWTLLSAAPVANWFTTDERTAWYPTMRLFRQTKPGDWTGVVEQVRGALETASTEI